MHTLSISYLHEYPGQHSLPYYLLHLGTEEPAASEKRNQTGLECMPDGTPERSGHTKIGYHPGSFGEYPFIIGLHVCMGPIHHRYSPIEEVRHIHKLRSCFAMEVYYNCIISLCDPRKNPLDTLKRIVEVLVHKDRGHKIDDQKPLSVVLDYLPPSSRHGIIRMFQIIRRTDLDGVRTGKYISRPFEIGENMVSSGQHIETEVLHEEYMFFDRSLPSGDVLGIGDHEIGSVFLAERADVFLNHPAPGASKYVSENKYLHKKGPLRINNRGIIQKHSENENETSG